MSLSFASARTARFVFHSLAICLVSVDFSFFKQQVELLRPVFMCSFRRLSINFLREHCPRWTHYFRACPASPDRLFSFCRSRSPSTPGRSCCPQSPTHVNRRDERRRWQLPSTRDCEHQPISLYASGTTALLEPPNAVQQYRQTNPVRRKLPGPRDSSLNVDQRKDEDRRKQHPVSYTHLTLPTIYSE